MSDGAGEIVIKGGSVTIDFEESLFPKKNGDPNRHENANRKLTRIKIIDKHNNEETVIFDSGDSPGGLKFETHFTTK